MNVEQQKTYTVTCRVKNLDQKPQHCMWLWFITFILVVANGAGQIEGKRERLGSGRIAWCDPHLARFFHSFANKRVNNVYQFAPFYRQATFIYDELKMCTWAHVFKFKRRWYGDAISSEAESRRFYHLEKFFLELGKKKTHCRFLEECKMFWVRHNNL